MNELNLFENSEFGSIRTVIEDGKVLFCGNDVAKALGYSNPRDALNRHCKGVVKRDTLTGRGVQSISFIPEGDVYRLTAKSELPGADKFERWIFDEVLPSIRNNGGYISGQEELSAEELLAKAIKLADSILAKRDQKIAELTAQNKTMLPKAQYFDELCERNTLTNIRNTAKEFKIKQKDFVDWLIGNGYLYRDQKGRLMPYAQYITGDNKYFELKDSKSSITKWSGQQLFITPIGKEAFRVFVNKLK